MGKQKKIQEELTLRIGILLTKEINSEERIILSSTLKSLKKSAYLPAILNELRGNLTPLAIKGTISSDVADFYKDLNSSKFMYRNLGGIISIWSNIFK